MGTRSKFNFDSSLHPSLIESKWFIVLLGSLTAFDPLSIDMYLPAFKNIQADLNTTYASVELSLSSFFIGMSLGQLIYGPISDRYGRKKPLLVGMIIYMLSTFACAFATNVEMLITFRILQALGGCAGMVITRAIVRDTFGPQKMASFFSSMALVMGLAPILAPTIGGFIIQYTSWRGIFYFLGAMNIICFFCIIFFIPETHFNRTSDLKFKSIFATYWDILKDRKFVGYTLPDSFIRAGMFAYVSASPFVFMEIYKMEANHYAWLFGMNAFGLIAATQVNKHLLKSHAPDFILGNVRPITLISATALLVLPIFFQSVVFVTLPLFSYLVTMGFVGANSSAMALAHQGHRAGSASAMYGMIQWGSAILTSTIVSIFHNHTLYPMTVTIFICALISIFGFKFLIGDEKFQY